MENGRKKIFTDLIPTGNIEVDKNIIPKILDNALSVHSTNVSDIEVLTNYFFNKTDIENKQKTQQPDINNKIALPYANLAVTTINSYCFSNPFTRSSRASDETITEKLKLFNDALDDDSYDAKTVKTEFRSGICGLGYRFIQPANESEILRQIWFKTSPDLDPTKTFIVRANTIDQEKVLACFYYTRKIYDDKATEFKQETVYNVYTKYHYWILIKGNGASEYTFQNQPYGQKTTIAYPLVYNKIPIIEYERKQDRTSDFEVAKGIIDAINNLTSTRLDDVNQAVDYIISLRDIECETDEDIDKITKAIKQRILTFKSISGATVQPEIKILNAALNQSEIQTLQDFLCVKCEEALNIPNRETRGSSGDTGQAVENRAGYKALENIAGLISMCAKEAENEALDVILSICEKQPNCPFAGLKVNDIEIKANRNKVENVTTASTAYSTLRSAGMNDQDALAVSQIVPDPIGTAKRNSVEQEEKFKKEQELLKQQQKSDENKADTTSKETNKEEQK